MYDRSYLHDAQQLELRAASGYINYAALLTDPINISRTLMEFRDKNFLQEIANTEHGAQITKPGQILRFRHPVRGSVHRYQLNQRLKTDIIDFRFVEICMNRALYANLKIEICDEKMSTIKQAISEWRSSVAEEAKDQQLREVLAHAIMDVPMYAMGNAAGYREGVGGVNLGSDARPLQPVPGNSLNVLDLMRFYAETANWPKDNDRWAITDYDMFHLIHSSPKFRESCCLGDLDKNSLVSGRMPVAMIAGWKLHITDKLPPSPNGNRMILFGHKKAITYGSDVCINRVVEPTEDFSKRYQWLWIYGFGVVYRHFLGLVIWNLDQYSPKGIHDLPKCDDPYC